MNLLFLIAMLISGSIAAVISLLIMGIGLAIGVVACAALIFLIGMGVVSSSALIGFWKGRLESGLQAFFLQSGAIAGVFAGASVAWLFKEISPTFVNNWATLGLGAAIGASCGITMAFVASLVMNVTIKRLSKWGSLHLPQRGKRT